MALKIADDPRGKADSPLMAKVSLATQICKVNPQRFNEAVAAGFYPCAPETVAGLPRAFDVEDMVTLRVYGHLIDEGMKPRSAGVIACGLRALLAEHPGLQRAVWIKSDFGIEGWRAVQSFEADRIFLHGDPNGGEHTEVVSYREWRLGGIRGYIVGELERAALIVGN